MTSIFACVIRDGGFGETWSVGRLEYEQRTSAIVREYATATPQNRCKVVPRKRKAKMSLWSGVAVLESEPAQVAVIAQGEMIGSSLIRWETSGSFYFKVYKEERFCVL